MARVEDDFREFQKKGDPAALARIFDALAPQLLLVAAHLTRDEAQAEDLVQETFLQVIESARSFEGRGTLRSWLTGILLRKARMARRRQARRPDPERIEGMLEVDPADEAEARELMESMGRALETLPAPYRQVLNLRLVHGFSAVEISRTLERPPATVHTQLRRGLELLRKKLPKGLALPAAVILQGRGLAIVRQAVLERAASVTTASAGLAMIGGVLLMKNWIVAGAAALGLLVLWQVQPNRRAEGAGSGKPVSEQGPRLSGDVAQETGTNSSPGVDSTRLLPGARAPVEPAVPPDMVVIRGRCLEAETGQPLSGCRVSIGGSYAGGAPQERYRELNGDRPDQVTTNVDGLFEFTMHNGPDFGFRLTCAAEGRAVGRMSWSRLAGGEVVDLGDIPLPLGTAVRGRAVDPDQHRLAGVRLAFHMQTRPEALGFLSPGDTTLWVTTNADGTFEGRNPAPAGAFRLHESSRRGVRFRAREPVSFRSSPETRTVDLTVVLEEVAPAPGPPTISGIAVDDTGEPVRGVSLRVQSAKTDPAVPTGSSGDTDGEGRFSIQLRDAIVGTPQAEGPQWILSSTPAYEPLFPERTYAWGDEDVVVDPRGRVRPLFVGARQFDWAGIHGR